MQIKWIKRQHFSQGRSARRPDNVHPDRVRRSAPADIDPLADLYHSSRHALLIEVKDLVNGTSIDRAVPESMTDIEYFHIELETHEVILAEGSPVETLLLTDEREHFANFVEYERLYGKEVGLAMVLFAPMLGTRGSWAPQGAAATWRLAGDRRA